MADLRQGMRRLLHHRGQTLLSIVVVALGIASATSVFALLQAVVLAPLPYPESRDLVRVYQVRKSTGTNENPYQRTFQSILDGASTLPLKSALRPGRRAGDATPPPREQGRR